MGKEKMFAGEEVAGTMRKGDEVFTSTPYNKQETKKDKKWGKKADERAGKSPAQLGSKGRPPVHTKASGIAEMTSQFEREGLTSYPYSGKCTGVSTFLVLP